MIFLYKIIYFTVILDEEVVEKNLLPTLPFLIETINYESIYLQSTKYIRMHDEQSMKELKYWTRKFFNIEQVLRIYIHLYMPLKTMFVVIK
jgi:hypothetical protein